MFWVMIRPVQGLFLSGNLGGWGLSLSLRPKRTRLEQAAPVVVCPFLRVGIWGASYRAYWDLVARFRVVGSLHLSLSLASVPSN